MGIYLQDHGTSIVTSSQMFSGYYIAARSWYKHCDLCTDVQWLPNHGCYSCSLMPTCTAKGLFKE